MGGGQSNQSKPAEAAATPQQQPCAEFKTVFRDQYVKYGENITISCKVEGEKVTATWEKDGCKLLCVEGKHTVNYYDRTCTLEIKGAEEADEGKYTLTVKNDGGSASHFAMVYVELKDQWRKVTWEQNDEMISKMQNFSIYGDDVKELCFLLYGPIGSGKSSIINTIKSIFAGRQYVNCLAADAEAADAKSHTLCYEKFVISKPHGESLPFAFFDMMGIEGEKNGGVHTDDIIKCLKGHVQEGYMFNPLGPLTEDSLYYNAKPSLNDKMHCLLCIVPADKISQMEKTGFIEKMNTVRKEASRLGIPQGVFLTRVDCACKMTKEALKNIYKSKKIRQKIKECSVLLTVPENCIFPVENYHDDTNMKDDINCLMLDALTHVVHWANDYVEKCSNK